MANRHIIYKYTVASTFGGDVVQSSCDYDRFEYTSVASNNMTFYILSDFPIKKYQLYMVTNGTARVQYSRIASAGLAPYFKDIFVSQEIGVNKPEKAYFDACFAKIPGFDREKAIIVGDSLSSDIRGGKNAGIKTCWVNPKGKEAPAENTPDYEIKSITELEELLKTL